MKPNLSFDPLGDKISTVRLLDHMGDDLRVVNAARVSMGKTRQAFGDDDHRLIRYLAKHNHWTPFSHCLITLHIKMPMFVARQWFKHQIGFTRNEVSRRYVDTPPEFYLPQQLRLRAENVKQGSSDETMATPMEVRGVLFECMELYDLLINDLDVAPEEARMYLPQNLYTEFYETASLAGYARLCGLRLDSHAQSQTRAYAESVAKIMADLFPASWQALSTQQEPS